LCGVGLCLLALYENTPATAVEGPALWPSELLIPRAKSGYTLVVAIHPQCPCTAATLQELAVAITHCPHMQVDLLFIKPPKMPVEWVKSDLWRTASAFPNSRLIVDEQGKLSATLHAQNSGQTYLYDADGHLVYSGGLTASRGHAGDNDGLGSIISIVNKETTISNAKPVFGCPLFNSSVGKLSTEK